MKLEKRIILIGGSQEGKTTICQYINSREIKYEKHRLLLISEKI